LLDIEETIKAFVLDVDGVLTSGSIVYDQQGNELKFFNVQDGFAISQAMKHGYLVYFVTARESVAVSRRATELGICKAYQGIKDKKIILDKIVADTRLLVEQIAYIGDDIVDLPIMTQVGLPVAVANACQDVKACAKIVTVKEGGAGAVRELIERVLRKQGVWQRIIDGYSLKPAKDQKGFSLS